MPNPLFGPRKTGTIPSEAFNDLEKQTLIEEMRCIPIASLFDVIGTEIIPGYGRFSACCPLHQETTPSFVATYQEGEKETWRCFGECNAGGNIIDLVQELKGFQEPYEAALFLKSLF